MGDNSLLALMIVSWCITLSFVSWLALRKSPKDKKASQWPTIVHHESFTKEPNKKHFQKSV
jgi:hypothetical protein